MTRGKTIRALSVLAIGLLVGWVAGRGDPNDRPIFGDTGLPKNCRAIVQANIDAYRGKTSTPDEVIASLERNCGATGYSWGR